VYSLIATGIAILAVAFLIMLRYRKIKLIVPIVIINAIEILLTLAVIGGFGTLDLAAMAGIITLIGTGTHDQLIITDEMLKNRGKLKDLKAKQLERDAAERVKRAFYIVLTAAGIAIASMLPLLLSGIVEITGFALATIIGVLIGVTLTRPVYGLIMQKLYGYSID
jgi:preprotein translocase subunit SecD